MKALQSGRKKVTFNKLKAVVFDEADVYFSEAETVESIKKYILTSFSHNI